MTARGLRARTLLAIATCALLGHIASAQAKQAAASAPSAIPDVAGIRPGMSAEEAYKLLKARNPNIRIGIGQIPIPAFGEKPIVTEMRAVVEDRSAPETLTVWLTIPPGKQVVLAVGRVLEYDPSQPLLRSKVLDGLREKYGPETENSLAQVYWAFDEQGRRPEAAPLRQANCGAIAPASLNVGAPQGVTYPAPSSLIYPVQQDSACNAYIRVTAEIVGAGGLDQTYARRITVMVWDLHLHRQAQQAYQAYLANGAKAQSESELAKAKQRTVPKF
jgi:hypothetical protein